MSTEPPDWPGYNRLDGVQDPEDASGAYKGWAMVSIDDLKFLQLNFPRQWANTRSAAEVLESPDRIFKFLRNDDDGEYWCYSKKIRHIYGDSPSDRFPAADDEVYVAVLNSSRILFEWGPEKADPMDQFSPIGAHSKESKEYGRFGELVFSRKR